MVLPGERRNMRDSKNNVLYFVRIIGVLTLITMLLAALLALVNDVTKDVIAENDRKKTEEAVKGLFPDAESPEAIELAVNCNDTAFGQLFEVKSGEETIGYYASVNPVGFKGEINMLVGLDTEGKICGVRILSMNETVGIGDVVKDEGFLSGFIGKSGSVEYVKGGGEGAGQMDGISGATYSSKAVIVGCNAALTAYAAYISESGVQ